MPKKPHKVLIVKLGYSETLVSENRPWDATPTCSLGDVFRTTVALHLYKDCHVTWLTDRAAIPLLEGNPHIDRILPFDLLGALQLLSERYDVVINLEKIPGVCALVSRINAWSHFGFRFDQETGRAEAYEQAHEALAIATHEDYKRLNDKSWAEILYSMLGARWQGESPILGYRPTTSPTHDLGFNIHVGRKFPAKAWPTDNWRLLEHLILGRYSITRQQHLDNIHRYMDWINTCRVLVTNDSLGMHLALSLGKKVLLLIGPTASMEISPHKNLKMLFPDVKRDCMPCGGESCRRDDSCMRYISPESVLEIIDNWEGAFDA